MRVVAWVSAIAVLVVNGPPGFTAEPLPRTPGQTPTWTGSPAVRPAPTAAAPAAAPTAAAPTNAPTAGVAGSTAPAANAPAGAGANTAAAPQAAAAPGGNAPVAGTTTPGSTAGTTATGGTAATAGFGPSGSGTAPASPSGFMTTQGFVPGPVPMAASGGTAPEGTGSTSGGGGATSGGGGEATGAAPTTAGGAIGGGASGSAGNPYTGDVPAPGQGGGSGGIMMPPLGSTEGAVPGDTALPTSEPYNRRLAPVPECQQAIACYGALSHDLCIDNDPTCTSAMTVRRSVSSRDRCAEMLDRAPQIAIVFAAGRSAYTLPMACRR